MQATAIRALNMPRPPRDCCPGDRVFPFHAPTRADIPAVHALMQRYAPSRSCHFTVGGVMMWADYSAYAIHVADDTLWVRGRADDSPSLTAYMVPVGPWPLERSVERLRAHCRAAGEPLTLTAVSEELLPQLRDMGARRVTEMEGWADYVYDVRALATLSGKKLNKKRNHVNRFVADNPGYRLLPLDASTAPLALDFYAAQPQDPDAGAMALYDRREVMLTLSQPGLYPMMEGAVLATPDRGVVAFTLGEVVGDTLVTHVEKMSHDVAGAGEAINKLYAQAMLARHPSLLWVNREEDVGDPGLRRAKQSYHPAFMIRKYRVEM